MDSDNDWSQYGAEIVAGQASIPDPIGVRPDEHDPASIEPPIQAWLIVGRAGPELLEPRLRRYPSSVTDAFTGGPGTASGPRAGRARPVGWSLVIAAVANVVLGLATIATGATPVGLIACSALAVASIALVTAEILSRYFPYSFGFGWRPTPTEPPSTIEH